ncbi:MAG: hypothetical protein AAFV47_09220 [Pseudomonadota bacterium]
MDSTVLIAGRFAAPGESPAVTRVRGDQVPKDSHFVMHVDYQAYLEYRANIGRTLAAVEQQLYYAAPRESNA